MLTIDFSFRELEIFCKVVELESFLGLEKGEISIGVSTIPGENILRIAPPSCKAKHKFLLLEKP